MIIPNMEKRIEDTYEELSGMIVTLDPDPLEYGPERITLRFSNLDKHAQRLTQIELQLFQDIHEFKKSFTEEKLIYQAKKYKLMATNLRIKAEKTKSEREASADRFLEEEVNMIRRMENDIADLEIVQLSVQVKRKDLKDTESRLRNQMKMVQESINRLSQSWKRNPVKDPENTLKKLSHDLGAKDPEQVEIDQELEDFYNN